MKEVPEPEKRAARPHAITIDERARAVVTGVEDVDSFNEQMIVLNTSAGAMTLVGEALHVSKLNLDDGQLVIEGRVLALEYDDRGKAIKGGARRLFR